MDTHDELLARILYAAARKKEKLRSTQTNDTRSSFTSYKVHWGWWWDFRKFTSKFIV